MKVYVTKYALTRGILEFTARERKALNPIVVDDPDGMNKKASFYGSDWHADFDAAQARAEQMRDARMRLLRKQIEKLENMRFTIKTVVS